MRRASIWIQLVIGWLPVWALYFTLLYVMHEARPLVAALAALRAIVPAALLGLLVSRFARRFPWPRPFRVSFVLLHLAAAVTYSLSWVLSVSVVESLLRLRVALVVGPGFTPFFVLGIWLYVMVAGVSYSQEATERAARAEAAAARAQLAALRSQLHPHFIFNALHTVVQLIPREPARAADAAERVAQLLRTVVEEDRDVITLREEWQFVERYVEIERIRFGDRLVVDVQISEAALAATVPSFALQTLVENAVQHGAAPRVELTRIEVSADVAGDAVTLRVRDDGVGAAPDSVRSTGGTGLSRLRERIAVLYGSSAKLAMESASGRGFTATLTIPLAAARDDGE
jgi:signal transduction histidine kinase